MCDVRVLSQELTHTDSAGITPTCCCSQLNWRAKASMCTGVCKIDASCTYDQRTCCFHSSRRDEGSFLSCDGQWWLRPVQETGWRLGHLRLEGVTPSAAAPGCLPALGNATGWCSLKPGHSTWGLTKVSNRTTQYVDVKSTIFKWGSSPPGNS